VIPRIIHRAWLGGPEPEWTRPFAETWERPGWEVREWTDDNIRDLFPLANQDIFDRAEGIAPDHVGQLLSDVLRYELLHRFGGVWVDCDFECLRPIDDLIAGVTCFAAWEVQDRWIGNTILGCSPGHPAMKAVIDGLPRNVRRRAGSRPNKLSGPQYLSRVWRARRDVSVLDQKLFYPYSWSEIDQYAPGDSFPDAYTIHHWANQRREKGVPA
jgi:inositol phosphorylceramide mannosyltransferase catalytic subunit